MTSGYNSFYWSWEKLMRNSTTSKWRIPLGQDYTNSWYNWKRRCNLLEKEESSRQHHSCILVKEHCIFGRKQCTCSHDWGLQHNTCVQKRWTLQMKWHFWVAAAFPPWSHAFMWDIYKKCKMKRDIENCNTEFSSSAEFPAKWDICRCPILLAHPLKWDYLAATLK